MMMLGSGEESPSSRFYTTHAVTHLRFRWTWPFRCLDVDIWRLEANNWGQRLDLAMWGNDRDLLDTWRSKCLILRDGGGRGNVGQ